MAFVIVRVVEYILGGAAMFVTIVATGESDTWLGAPIAPFVLYGPLLYLGFGYIVTISLCWALAHKSAEDPLA